MARKRDPIGMLGSVPLFEGLSGRELQAMRRAGKEVAHRAGRVIVKEGAPGVAFHLIIEGVATVSVRGRTRRRLGPGDYFGEISLIDRKPRSATVTAETDVRTMVLPAWSFGSLIEDNPRMAGKLMVELARRLRSLERSITS